MNKPLKYLSQNFKKARSSAHFNFILMTLVLVVEIELFTTWRSDVNLYARVFIFFGIQLLISILPFFLIRKTPKTEPQKANVATAIPLSMAAISGIIYAFNVLKPLFDARKIQVSDSDILPQVQRFCREMTAGRFPYTPFADFGWPMTPTYLPMQWLPYVPSEYFGIDPRWLTFSIFTVIYGIFTAKVIKNGGSVVKGLVFLAMPILLISLVGEHDSSIWSVTVEQLIMAYYLLLGISLTTDSRAFQIVAIVMCLMSRFSLIFWLPLFIFVMWTKEGTRQTLSFCGWIAAACALIYGPFLLKDPLIFTKAQAYYDLATERTWLNETKPAPIYSGFGFALYFFEKTGEKVQNIADLKQCLFWVTPSVSALLAVIWGRFKDKFDAQLFVICSLKISLAIFYVFIQIPYPYLYITPIIMSLAVFYRLNTLSVGNVK
jgi:hypothetical protein